jgi:hypothetical protein
MSTIRTRWAAIGAAVAITLGGGGVGLVAATQPDGASTLVPITPCRVIDTRPEFNVGPKASPLGPGETHTVAAHGDNGDCTGIPAEAVALSMNVTAVDATAPTFLTIWANGVPRPTTSSLNPTPGQPPTPNAVTTDLSSAGEFDIFNLAGNVHVLADINGYYTDHHHDDRYFGFGNTLRSADTSGGATSSSGVVSFPDVDSPTMSISFGLPPGRIDGRPILVQIPFRGPPDCTFVLSADGASGPTNDSDRFTNTSWTVVDSPDGSVDLGPLPSGDIESTVVVTLSNESAGQLGAGASVEMNLRRVATSLNDTCAGTVRARGGYSVEY